MFEAERRRRDAEREARERESQKRLDQMQAYMDNLVKLVEGTAKQHSRGSEITVKLVPLNEKDDVEAYLVTFERIMAAHNISEDRWSHYLTSQLTGKAQLAFAAVSPSDSGNYEKIKAAILIRYGINEEEYRRRFRSARRKDGETNRELAVRLMEWQVKSVEENRAAQRRRYEEDLDENRVAKRRRYEEDLEENRAAKRRRYEENLEENRAAK